MNPFTQPEITVPGLVLGTLVALAVLAVIVGDALALWPIGAVAVVAAIGLWRAR